MAYPLLTAVPAQGGRVTKRPLLMERHGVASVAEAEAVPARPPVAKNLRLARTLLVAALVPEVPSLPG